jgi:hypothetical protein
MNNLIMNLKILKNNSYLYNQPFNNLNLYNFIMNKLVIFNKN